MSETFVETVVLEKLRCGGCGITFAVPEYWINERRNEGGEFRCPNGCTRVFKESENSRLKRELEEKQRMLTAEKCETLRQRQLRASVEESLAKETASKARLRRRVQNGVCPCCNRTFTNLAAHMKSQHPK